MRLSQNIQINLRSQTRKLISRMWSPLCGLDQQIGFLLRSHDEPRFMIAGAQLAGVHVLRGLEEPPPGGYHIGGSGVYLDEALIRTLGETVERYSQLISEVSDNHTIVYTSYDEMRDRDELVIDASHLRFYSDRYYDRPGFPFQRFASDALIGWIKVPSLIHGGRELWVPAQLLLVGYLPKHHDGEPWLLASMTTGSAAHTAPLLALRNALMELVQIDSTMGHWYSPAVAPRIEFDQRTQAMENLINRLFGSGQPRPKFFWLRNPDLPGFTVACQIRQAPQCVPVVGTGLGGDLTLSGAMYKALLEAVGVIQLAKLELMTHSFNEDGMPIDPRNIYDLDRNVAYYAQVGKQVLLDHKFSDAKTVWASDLPPDIKSSPTEDVRLIVNSFAKSQKELVFMNLTTPDIAQLGFTAVRVWSADTLSLCLPSAPPVQHQRFQAYGGVTNEEPHPYP